MVLSVENAGAFGQPPAKMQACTLSKISVDKIWALGGVNLCIPTR